MADDDQAGAGHGSPGDGGQGGDTLSTEQRLDRLDQRQGKLEGMLETVLDRLPGGGGSGHGGGGNPGGPGGTDPDIESKVREQIEAAEQRRAAEEKDKQDSDWRAGIDAAMERFEKLHAELAPREPQQGLRGRVQRALIGRPE